MTRCFFPVHEGIHFNATNQTIYFELNDVLIEHRHETNPDLRVSDNDPAPITFANPDESFIGPPPPEKPPEWLLMQSGAIATDPIDLAPLFRGDRKPKLSEMTIKELIEDPARILLEV